MTESMKEIADRLFNSNQAPTIDLLPPREISLEEMLSYRTQSEHKLKEKRSKRISRSKKENTGDIGDPCPKCGISKWDEFPDSRKYCLNCGAVKEIDGTVVGGAIMKEITKGGEPTMIEGELRCEQCGKIQPFSATEKELMEFIKEPHKNCGGRILFGAVKDKLKGRESKTITEASKQNIERVMVSGNSERCDHPKRDIFVCNNCPDFNYCSQKNIDAVICLLIGIDLKLKKLLGR